MDHIDFPLFRMFLFPPARQRDKIEENHSTRRVVYVIRGLLNTSGATPV